MAHYGGLQPWDNGPVSGMRASHADRERAVDVLKAAFAEGRLGQHEYEQRVGAAYSARTYGELSGLVADLPQGPVPMAMPTAGPQGVPAVPATFLAVPPRPTNGLAAASLICGIAGTILGVPAIPAIVLGHRARAQIRTTREGGEAMATTGLVLGWLVVSFWTLIILLGIGLAGA
ncbi:DUF1707 and DUF4190 domain-containing protein [Streptomyces sp. NPDC020096]